MRKYGKIAVNATILAVSRSLHPKTAWDRAEQSMHPEILVYGQNLGPKEAYLALCEAGRIKNIPSGEYSIPAAHKNYALDVLSLLQDNMYCRALSSDEIWKELGSGEEHNFQVDVVLELVKSGLIDNTTPMDTTA